MDRIVTALAYDKKVRVFIALSTNTVNEAIRLHRLNLMSAMALGRLLTVTAIMSYMTQSESIAVQVSSEGPMKGVLAISDEKGKVKGYVTNNDYTTYGENITSLGQLLMPGKLMISRDFGLKEPYTGITRLITGEIAEDIARYYMDSEQTPTACALGTYFDDKGKLLSAGGYIIQVLPGTEDRILDEIEQRVSLTGNISKLIYDLETPENLLNFLFSDRNPEITGTHGIAFKCSCSKEKILDKLLTIDKEQLNEVAKQQSTIEAVCPYCNSHYHYHSKDILKIIE
ncbi:MAG TPA: Hsp33 family molecular chaperone HslO [Clostridia bacterium]|jgi:molecular chaperone Hsp33|nr:Hsp33 family molecular chaperone HslO [Clostridiaceae bacterium]HOF26759.1 Hsp33 family molecular chaperone HslO [Clostridia bacterium]HOR89030.1 Hsp33 family molecular chaperone HslO [Clostridia bacterium]